MSDGDTNSGLAWSAADDDIDVDVDDADLYAAAPDDMLMPGELVGGRYEIVDILGEGGFGVVYRAHQREMGRDVAIKTLRRGIVDYEEAAQRFRREARLARHLTHPHTIRLFDFGQTESGVLYICMEYLEGETLEDRIFRRGTMRLDEMLSAGMQIAESLAEAHQNGIVHRDMKPSNVFLSEIGGQADFVKVLDFGIAKVTQPWVDNPEHNNKLTRTGTAFGSPAYMAPEQVRGVQITSAADCYSWGLIMLEALTGEQVVDGNSPFDVALKQASPQPIPVPAWIDDSPLGGVIKQALSKEVEDRFADASALLEALEGVDDDALQAYMGQMTEEIAFEDLLEEAFAAEVEVSAPEREELAEKRRGRMVVIVALVAVFIAAVSVTLLVIQNKTAEEEAPREPTPPPTEPQNTSAVASAQLAELAGRSMRSSVSGAVTEQILPRRPLGLTSERVPYPMLARSGPAVPIVAMLNAYRVLETVPMVEALTEDARVETTHPVGLPLTRGALMASFAGGSKMSRVVLKFHSRPRGASVFRRGESVELGKTPLEIETVKAPVDRSYRFEAWGYEPIVLGVSHAENGTTNAVMRKRIKTNNTITVPD